MDPVAIRAPQSVRLTMVAARRLGMSARLLDPGSGYLLEIRRGDQVRRVLGSLTGLNSAVAARLSQDKMYTELILREAGFSTPTSARCIKPGHYRDAAYESRSGVRPGLVLAREHGYPLVVKPNRLALGRHVALVHDRAALERAVHAVWQDDALALVQTVAPGRDLRINLLDGQALVAYWRNAVAITGDGQRSIHQLLVAADARHADDEFFARARASTTWRRCVAAHGLEPSSILAPGQTLDFAQPALDVRHFATFQLVEEVPRPWVEWCADVARTVGLRYLGIDLEVPVEKSSLALDRLDPRASTILETNAAPTMNRMCKLGHEERALAAQMRVVEALFA